MNTMNDFCHVKSMGAGEFSFYLPSKGRVCQGTPICRLMDGQWGDYTRTIDNYLPTRGQKNNSKIAAFLSLSIPS